MKGSRLKILTIILAIVLVILVGFVGVYTPVQNRMENQVRDYTYAMDIKGSRTVELQISDSTSKVVKDAEGKEVEDASSLTDEEIKEKGYTTEEVKDNPDEIKTKENYEKAKKVVESRLESAGAQEYTVRLNEETGNIVIELDETP